MWRIEEVRKIPAAIRFISAEPLLESLVGIDLTNIHWLIAGGESGANYRRMKRIWAEELQQACAASGTAFFLSKTQLINRACAPICWARFTTNGRKGAEYKMPVSKPTSFDCYEKRNVRGLVWNVFSSYAPSTGYGLILPGENGDEIPLAAVNGFPEKRLHMVDTFGERDLGKARAKMAWLTMRKGFTRSEMHHACRLKDAVLRIKKIGHQISFAHLDFCGNIDGIQPDIQAVSQVLSDDAYIAVTCARGREMKSIAPVNRRIKESPNISEENRKATLDMWRLMQLASSLAARPRSFFFGRAVLWLSYVRKWQKKSTQ